MSKQVTRIVRWVVFAVLALLGIVGLILPVIPQVPFFIAAAVVIMPESRWLRKKYVLWRRRHPRYFHALERWRRERRAARQERRRRWVRGRGARPAAPPGAGGPAPERKAPVALPLLAALLLAPGSVAGGERAAARVYRISPEGSSLVFKSFRDGWLSSLAHDHSIAARDFEGAVALDRSRVEASSVTLTVRTAALEVVDPGVDPDERAEIATTLRSDEVLDVARFPEIRLASTGVEVLERGADGRFAVEVRGDLTLHGKTRPIAFPLTLTLPPPATNAPLGAAGALAIDQSDYAMTPSSAFLGAVKVKDGVQLEFSIEARP